MYQAPEVFHLERAVKAIKQNLVPEKQAEPIQEDSDKEQEQSSEDESTE